MEFFETENICKYCKNKLELCVDEGLECAECKNSVHVKCLKRGSVPGGLNGDVFFTYVCEECSTTGNEVFSRNKLSWLQIITLVMYHLQTKSPGLARKGFFHWRSHVATFIDRNWETIFPIEVKRKKRWTGTIAGTLSHFSSYIFLSGTTVFNEQAWWTLMFPKLSPSVISYLHSQMPTEKQKLKLKNEKRLMSDGEIFRNMLPEYIKHEELYKTFSISNLQLSTDIKDENFLPLEVPMNTKGKNNGNNKRKFVLPSIGTPSKKIMNLANSPSMLSDEFVPNFHISDSQEKSQPTPTVTNNEIHSINKGKEPVKLLDPYCHYNTSLNSISRLKGQKLQIKLTGGIRKEQILSPYSAIYLKPYIRRDVETYPTWLRLMAELQIVANKNNSDYVLPPRAPIDYTYVQPEHIPAINSICNQFFWPGIDRFAFLVPDVKHTENYISFVFTRPTWRNCGIAKFMVYHLIQTSLGKDITLHVSINSPALFLYQKFGFKVENVVLDFYDKYFRSDVKDSKHAFFCRLER